MRFFNIFYLSLSLCFVADKWYGRGKRRKNKYLLTQVNVKVNNWLLSERNLFNSDKRKKAETKERKVSSVAARKMLKWPRLGTN